MIIYFRQLLLPLAMIASVWFAATSPAYAAADISEMGDISELRDPQYYIDIEARTNPLDFLDVYDPLEPMNKRIYAFNRLFDEYVFLPALSAYRFVFPQFVRNRFQDFWANIGEIPNIYNSLFQLKIEKTAVSSWRLILNTTVGIGGLWDPATKWFEIERANEDFGQTLGHWGVGAGPFLVLPILGPSNLRDTTGLVTDYVAEREIDFLGVKEAESNDDTGGWLLKGFDALNQRDIHQFRYGMLGSPFEYNKVRYLFNQQRELLIAE
ncbi:MAG: VacJ family lipoprotein [Gammaproteobacteria bacterium]|nr:VacJ family lipoprotein [Gammaproteobacteria bacterium]